MSRDPGEQAARSVLRDEGEYIPPMQGDPVCDDYDEAGAGAIDADGFPQCASCGWPKTFHEGYRTV